jgi:ribosomal protein S27E
MGSLIKKDDERMLTNQTIVTCAFCGKVTDIETAQDESWTPGFCRSDGTRDKNIACPTCIEEHLVFDDDEGMVVKGPDHDPPTHPTFQN